MAAIYMWQPPGDVVVTTPLYPSEAGESLDVNVTVDQIFYNNFVISEYELNGGLILGGEIIDVLIFADPIGSEYTLGVSHILGGEIQDILLFADPVESEYRLGTSDILGGEVLDRLIITFTPNEEFELSIELHEINYTSA